MDLKTFLAWFSGYAENIKQKPTPEQWKRIKAEIEKLKDAPMSAPIYAAMPAAPTPPAKPPKPTTPAQWRAQYQAALLELGLDEESAKDFTENSSVDLARDPADAAKADTASMLN